MRKFRYVVDLSKEGHVERFKRWHAHPFGVPIFVFVGLLLVTGITLLVLTATHTSTTFRPGTNNIVIVTYDGQQQTVPTRERTVGGLLKKLNIKIGKADRIEPGLNTQIVQDNFRINVYRATPVTISDGKTVTTAYSAAATPRSVVAELGLRLYSDDRVTAEPAQYLVSQQSLGERIVISRSIPITLNVYGTVLSLRTYDALTVGQLLKSKNIKLTPVDTVVPSLDTPVTPNIQIFVVRKGTQIVSETQAIPPPVETITDASLSFGTVVTRQQGVAGSQVLTYQIETQNGKEVSRKLLQTVVTAQPVAQITARGLAVSIPADKQAVMAQAGIASSDFPYVDYIMSHESGWCPTKMQGQIGVCPGYAPETVPSNLGYGLGQATPGTKMAGFGADWKTNPVTQLRWATTYALGRYKSWEAAYNYWLSHHNW